MKRFLIGLIAVIIIIATMSVAGASAACARARTGKAARTVREVRATLTVHRGWPGRGKTFRPESAGHRGRARRRATAPPRGSLLAQLATLVVPGLRRLFGTAPIGVADGLVIGTAGSVPLLINEAVKEARLRAVRARALEESGDDPTATR